MSAYPNSHAVGFLFKCFMIRVETQESWTGANQMPGAGTVQVRLVVEREKHLRFTVPVFISCVSISDGILRLGATSMSAKDSCSQLPGATITW